MNMRSELSELEYNSEQDKSLKKALNDALQEYLVSHHDHRYADRGMKFKLAILCLFCAICYIAALHQSTLIWFSLFYFCYITVALLLAINVVHDASHNVFFRSERANKWLNCIITVPLGIDPDCWRVRHVIQHHPYTNVEYYDLDIDYNGVLRQTPFQVHYWFMRYQHYYWPIVAAMTFPAIVWCFDWQDRLGLKFNVKKFTSQGWNGWIAFLLAKWMHIYLAFILPAWVCPQFNFGWIVLIYCLSQMCSSLIFVVLILGSHWAKATFYQAPENGHFAHGRLQHAFNTTLNWHVKHSWLEYWLGGLNLHLTHHLYPGVSHRHYHKLTPIVENIARQFNISYQALSLIGLFKSQQKFLKKMGSNYREN